MTVARRAVVATMAVLSLAGIIAPPAAADPLPGPPYVDHVVWAKWGGDLSSLRVFPTPAGRDMAGRPGGVPGRADEAWSEVLTLEPDADLPGMRAQFNCHWQFAEIAEPGKVSWNLEPWRPVVSDNDMVAAGCNPGGPEEPF